MERFLSVCRKANILVSFLVDVALGVLLMSWLYRDNRISILANALLPAADVSQAVFSLRSSLCGLKNLPRQRMFCYFNL